MVFEKPEALSLRQLQLTPPAAGQVVVDVEWTGISTGTEKLLWSGRMPPFPGMGYPLVPGYETVGRISAVGDDSSFRVGDRVFVSGASCFGDIRGLFGGASSRLVVDPQKLIPVGDELEDKAILIALAATAHHALTLGDDTLPDLVIGHGVLGRLLARLCKALGGQSPVVWELSEDRSTGADGYTVMHPAKDERRDYRRIVDASGDPEILDAAMQHLGKRGEILLAGFYAAPLSFTFPPAFMREASIRIAAEWQPSDLLSVRSLIDSGALSLDGLITHRSRASDASEAYPIAFTDPHCLKMVLDWRS